ncbi:hypothetical protein GCM10010275_15940 [Streptomyces litmocidini]|nr:hypothetical protein GCM10010275_15940 [Streptomyces litmocidini]
MSDVAAAVATVAVAGPVMPATRATDVAVAMVRARALCTCARKSPPGVRDEVGWSVPARGAKAPAVGQRSMGSEADVINDGPGETGRTVWIQAILRSVSATGPR